MPTRTWKQLQQRTKPCLKLVLTYQVHSMNLERQSGKSQLWIQRSIFFMTFAFYIIKHNEVYVVAFRQVYKDLVEKGVVVPKMEVPPPTVPMDYNWARELGLIRKPASFMTSICDERGQELLYAGVPITTVFEEGLGIGGVLGLLWFQKRYCIFAHETAS